MQASQSRSVWKRVVKRQHATVLRGASLSTAQNTPGHMAIATFSARDVRWRPVRTLQAGVWEKQPTAPFMGVS
jgi:hypothetical protein